MADINLAPLNIARFDLVSIHLVILCGRSGSLSSAAKLAHMSISSASQRLTALESHLGCTLFKRLYRGLHPTDAGHIFIRHADEVLACVQRLNAGIQELKKNETIIAPIW